MDYLDIQKAIIEHLSSEKNSRKAKEIAMYINQEYNTNFSTKKISRNLQYLINIGKVEIKRRGRYCYYGLTE